MASNLGAADYREGALSRLGDTLVLRQRRRWVGAVYNAGRAVEAILRGLILIKTREHTQGHDLRGLLARVRSLGMLREHDEKFFEELSEVAVIWHNNLRFVGESTFLRYVKDLRKDRGIRGDPVKHIANRVVDACEAVVTRGDLVWQRSKTR